MKILIADDNEVNRLLAQSLLERGGHELAFADHGASALRLCKQMDFDLILMDTHMPFQDGLEVMQTIRQNKLRNHRTPVFAMTDEIRLNKIDAYKGLGFEMVLRKPLKPGDIKSAWSAYIFGNKAPVLKDDVLDREICLDTEYLSKTRIKELLCSGTPLDIRRIEASFWSSTERLIRELKLTVAEAAGGSQSNLNRSRKTAQKIKTATLTLGLVTASQISEELEKAPPEDLAHLTTSLIQALTESGKALSKALAIEMYDDQVIAGHFNNIDVAKAPTIISEPMSLLHFPVKSLAR